MATYIGYDIGSTKIQCRRLNKHRRYQSVRVFSSLTPVPIRSWFKNKKNLKLVTDAVTQPSTGLAASRSFLTGQVVSQVFHWALSRQGQRGLCPGVSVTAMQTPALLLFSPMAHSTDVREFKSLFSLFFLLLAFLTSLLLASFIFTPGNLFFFSIFKVTSACCHWARGRVHHRQTNTFTLTTYPNLKNMPLDDGRSQITRRKPTQREETPKRQVPARFKLGPSYSAATISTTETT